MTLDNGDLPANTAYDVAAYVWPSYHPDDRARIFWPQGIGEWETVMSNRAKYDGHDQPRQPLWGYINEADPYVAEMEISAAADHGVNVFIFDWYWYDSLPFLQGHLDNGYLAARNNDRVKFYLMWANHDVPLIWDKRNADDAFTRRNSSRLWQGGVNRESFEKGIGNVIANYFSHPSYYTIGGRPVFMIFDLESLIGGLGGVDETKAALDWFRSEVTKAGLPGLDLQLMLHRGDSPFHRGDSPSVAAQLGLSQKDLAEALGFDSLTTYHMNLLAPKAGNREEMDYQEVVRANVTQWESISDEYSQAFYPHVSVGWDTSPRANEYVGSVMVNNSPQNFEAALIAAKDFVDRRTDGAPPLVTVNSWNEWTETSYLQPDTRHGYEYLEAVRRVFPPRETAP